MKQTLLTVRAAAVEDLSASDSGSELSLWR